MENFTVPQWQHRPRTWPLVVTQTTDPVCTRASYLVAAEAWTALWPQLAAQATPLPPGSNVACGSGFRLKDGAGEHVPVRIPAPQGTGGSSPAVGSSAVSPLCIRTGVMGPVSGFSTKVHCVGILGPGFLLFHLCPDIYSF